jgi:hypothetical protein
MKKENGDTPTNTMKEKAITFYLHKINANFQESIKHIYLYME